MNKSERTSLLRRLKPATWYAFCQMEAMHHDEEIKISRAELALKLDLSLPTLATHIKTWVSHNLVQEIDGGFHIAQLDGQPSNIKEAPIVREFRNAKDIIDYWCIEYEKVYGTPYRISNYAQPYALKSVPRVHPEVPDGPESSSNLWISNGTRDTIKGEEMVVSVGML